MFGSLGAAMGLPWDSCWQVAKQKQLPLITRATFWDILATLASILGHVQIQQGTEIGSWAPKKHQKRSSKTESMFGAILGWFWASFLVKFKIFLKARAEMVEALICAHSLRENHVFEDPGMLKKEWFCVYCEAPWRAPFLIDFGFIFGPILEFYLGAWAPRATKDSPNGAPKKAGRGEKPGCGFGSFFEG